MEKKPISSGEIWGIVGILIGVLVGVWPMNWLHKLLFLLIPTIMVIYAVNNLRWTINSPIAHKILFSIIAFLVMAGVSWYPIHEQWKKDQQQSKSANYALVKYRIASSLPGTVVYDFLKDWKVWFHIESHDSRILKSYVTITFISDGIRIKAHQQPFYDGIKPIELNAYDPGWDLMGIVIPDEIKEKAKQQKLVQIQIDCEVKDERDKLIVKMLPVIYSYSYGMKSWHPEPGSS
jgi:putative effector of murein hydrolase LrgA (UPF0299 family)